MRRTLMPYIALAVVTLAAPGCTRVRCCQRAAVICKPEFHRVLLADFEGHPIAEYIAEGPITHTCRAVCFRAMQRRIFHPCILTFRYPLGRPVTVQGSNIVIEPFAKPSWIR